ncbi:sugar phosphate isomerase/epimerase family protein [Brachybacterium sp. AOP3-A1-3]|uniref:sugar phosphate isomerase/epimerase family protein n=1 Tax=Brachybacterium sp. AOP3-A1-3 TaxID=3457699 RepID=UPI004033318C
MIRPGLCSVTFRSLEVDRVVELAADAGLACIEWAGDAHVPPGDTIAASRARELTEQAGLAVASYGSYLRFEGSDEEFSAELEGVITSARALGAPRIRVWAGSCGSADVGAQDRAALVRRIQEFADRASEHGIDVGLEFHGRTLTDEIGSTLRLLDAMDRPTVLSYWQPHQGMPDADALETLRQVLPRASTIHVFSWWPTHERHPLAARADLWRGVFTVLAAEGSDRDALLEFLPGDDPAALAGEAGTLRALIAAAVADSSADAGTDGEGGTR